MKRFLFILWVARYAASVVVFAVCAWLVFSDGQLMPPTGPELDLTSAASASSMSPTPAPPTDGAALRMAPPIQARRSIAPDADSVLQTAKDACSRDETIVEVDLTLPTGVPDIPGLHPAIALCHDGHLIHLTFARGEDPWIVLSPTPDGPELTVTDFGEDEEPTGYRTWLDGRLVETGQVTVNAQGVSDMLIFRNGRKAKRYGAREGLLSASTVAAIEAHLDTLGLDPQARAHERANYFDRRAYIVQESFHDDGAVAFRRETFEQDLGDGWLLDQILSDLEGDGVVESWFVEKRHIDGRTTTVVVSDKDSDGRFEKLVRQRGDHTEVSPIDWPAERVDLARLRGLLLTVP